MKFRRVYGTRFYLVAWPEGHRCAAVVNDFGDLILVGVQAS